MTGRTVTAALPRERLEAVALYRLFALAGTLGLIGSFLLVLYDIVDTVGDPLLFYPVVLATLFAATLLSRLLRVRGALLVGGLLFVLGMGWHLLTLDAEFDLWVLVSNNVELLTGETVLRIQQADVWALTVAPTPVFVTWFLAVRRRYVGAVVAGGGMLSYLVLTGDAGTTLTLAGVVSAGIALGFGEIETTGWSGAADQTVLVLAVMVLVPLVVTIVPGGAATPISFADDEVGTMEDSVVGADTSLDIVGEVEQSPEERFTVTTEEPRLWRTGSYDRYTGDGWVRTTDADPLGDGELEEPSGPTRELTQMFETASSLSGVPSAWQPVGIGESLESEAMVASDGGLELDRSITTGERFEVTSAVPDADPADLNEAGRNYPESVRERYTQLPESTPDRVGDRTEQITQNADTPFETAVAVEQWLEANREYSLDVERPEGDVADAFLFEMDAGYCTYFATTMVAMLRAEEIPARMAVGYSPGEPVAEDEYLVRGLNSHAWVEVYFPDIGWVEFDPTPSGPRQQTEQAAVQGGAGDAATGPGDLQEEGADDGFDEQADVGSPDTDDVEDEDSNGDSILQEQLQEQQLLGPDAPGYGTDDEPEDGFAVPLPSREQLVISVVALVGATAWVRQSGVVGNFVRRLSVRFQRRSDPETDVERAYERLMLVLEERHRERQTGETMRQYLDDIYASEEARQVVELYEKVRYGDGVTETDADEAVDLVKQVRKQA